MSMFFEVERGDPTEMYEKTLLFERYMEPYLRTLRTHHDLARMTRQLPQLKELLSLGHQPLRKVEYSFALQFLLAYLTPQDRYLAAGCGINPLPNVIAGQSIPTKACDDSYKVVRKLKKLNIQAIYGPLVNYTLADPGELPYADHYFDAISSISVLEQYPVPKAQQALQEFLRVLKPGGVLVITLGFQPRRESEQMHGYHFCTNLLAELISEGALVEIYSELLANEYTMPSQTAATKLLQNTPTLAYSSHGSFQLADVKGEIPIILDVQPNSVIPIMYALQKPS